MCTAWQQESNSKRVQVISLDESKETRSTAGRMSSRGNKGTWMSCGGYLMCVGCFSFVIGCLSFIRDKYAPKGV